MANPYFKPPNPALGWRPPQGPGNNPLAGRALPPLQGPDTSIDVTTSAPPQNYSELTGVDEGAALKILQQKQKDLENAQAEEEQAAQIQPNWKRRLAGFGLAAGLGLTGVAPERAGLAGSGLINAPRTMAEAAAKRKISNAQAGIQNANTQNEVFERGRQGYETQAARQEAAHHNAAAEDLANRNYELSKAAEERAGRAEDRAMLELQDKLQHTQYQIDRSGTLQMITEDEKGQPKAQAIEGVRFPVPGIDDKTDPTAVARYAQQINEYIARAQSELLRYPGVEEAIKNSGKDASATVSALQQAAADMAHRFPARANYYAAAAQAIIAQMPKAGPSSITYQFAAPGE